MSRCRRRRPGPAPCRAVLGNNVNMKTKPQVTDSLEGGCTCGALRYRLLDRPLFVHCCHCSWCQRETGSAFAVNALIESDRLEVLQGETEAVEIPSASGKGQVIVRCPECRIAVWSHYSGAGRALAFVRVGSLDQPASVPPDIHIFTSTKQRWVLLPPDVPAVPEYYRARDHWPAASLRRMQALKETAGN